ncbi:amino acid permease [Brevibacterium sp. 50QC2O2]|uniref:amino acid permease n=1 Tax=Brevibacterium sp. 50QC2O2 TaxID=2968459 RepID=UPI00211CD137|nr:amino acid permease [Brevibacterium sp. 50QC2O2]MCQ9387280.1 amino acid permease [Brevibacterium sp. 50QC2O2]
MSSLFRTKTVEQSIAETEEPEHALKKNLSALDLTVFGVGVTIGAGIFVLTGTAAATKAGPALVLSFVIAGIVCALAALCYAELASTVPVAGSAYTFAYATLGEFIAWIIGWDLILEFTLGSAALATSFSQYLAIVLEKTPFAIPEAIATVEGGFVNLPAGLLIIGLIFVLVSGVKLSSRINLVITGIKLVVVAIVVIAGLFFVKASNWVPFIPPAEAPAAAEGGLMHQPMVQALFGMQPSTFGVGGIFAGAAIVFFAFIGFDVVATTAEEVKNPQKDLPRGIMASLAIVVLLYIFVTFVITGMQSYKDIDAEGGAPMAAAFQAVGMDSMATIIAIGACIGLIVVAMILFMGQTRVGFAMARDGLLPQWFSKTGAKAKTPYRLTICTGIIIAIIAAFVPLSTLSEMVNIGTLAAFVVVSIGVIVLRRTRPDLQRSFRVPWVPVLPILSVIACLYLMMNLPMDTWLRFVVWLIIGVVVYFTWSRGHSRLGRAEKAGKAARAGKAE